MEEKWAEKTIACTFSGFTRQISLCVAADVQTAKPGRGTLKSYKKWHIDWTCVRVHYLLQQTFFFRHLKHMFDYFDEYLHNSAFRPFVRRQIPMMQPMHLPHTWTRQKSCTVAASCRADLGTALTGSRRAGWRCRKPPSSAEEGFQPTPRPQMSELPVKKSKH